MLLPLWTSIESIALDRTEDGTEGIIEPTDRQPGRRYINADMFIILSINVHINCKM